MVKVTDSAAAELKKYMAENQITESNLRVFISGLGWGGPQLGLAQDEVKPDDTQFKTKDLNFLLDSQIQRAIESYGNIRIDYRKSLWNSGYDLRFNRS